MFKKSISSVLLITIISISGASFLVYPKPTQALMPDVIGGPSQIVATAWEFVSDNADKITQKAQAAYASISAAYDIWAESESILAQAARVAAELVLRQVLSMLTNQIIEWIQGGGKPQFVSDWQGFLTDAFDKAGGLFVDKYLGAGYLCEPFDLSIKIALLPVPVFEERVACSLSDMGQNIQNFANDFSQGSWKEWINLTKPENNFYGGYFIAREEKLKRATEAEAAALNEANSAEGFLSPKVCLTGSAGETSCSDKDSCKTLKENNPGTFKCEYEAITTPGSVLSDITSKAINQPIKILEDQIADLADSMGIFGPYVAAIASALTNRVITEGLTYIKSSGPTISNPDISLPDGTNIPAIDKTLTQTNTNSANIEVLVTQQKLLQEALNYQLLSQQTSNLSIMGSIENIQIEILSVFAKIITKGCSFYNVYYSLDTIDATYYNVGTASIEQTIIPGEDGSSDTYVYEIVDAFPQILGQSIILENDILETSGWISKTNNAIATSNGYIQKAEEYLNLYKTTLQPPTEQEQTELDTSKSLLDTALNSVLSQGKTAVKMPESQNLTLTELDTKTQNTTIEVVEQAGNLQQIGGLSEDYPISASSLYGQKKEFNLILTQAKQSLSSCSSDTDGD